jgi:hypothetical protein
MIKRMVLVISTLIINLLISTGNAALIDSTPKICAAVRGNGEKLFVHFNTLAKMHEQYGMLWGISGGSSASVVAFMVDSIYSNPLLSKCDEQACSQDEIAARAALLLKSIEAYLGVLSAYPEVNEDIVSYVLMSDLQAENILDKLSTQPDKAVADFKKIITSEKFAPYLNPEILSAVESANNPAELVKDIIEGIDDGHVWRLESEKIFLRPGATSFNVLSDFLGRLGTFYASDSNLSNREGMLDFLKNCGTPGRNMTWDQVSLLKSGNSTCGSQYESLLSEYYKKSKAMGAEAPKHTNNKIGSGLHVLATVALLEGKSAEMWKQARKQYLSNQKIDWSPDFKDWSIGYAGRNEDLDLLLKNQKQYNDLKTLRASVLRDLTWKDILDRSPAEPSVSRGIETKENKVSIGGWMDSQPVQALKNISCDKVALFDSTNMMQFHEALARFFGASETEVDKLFSLKDPKSSISLAINEADGFWCSNFNETSFKNVSEMREMGWNATLNTKDPFFLKPRNSQINLNSNFSQSPCYPHLKLTN